VQGAGLGQELSNAQRSAARGRAVQRIAQRVLDVEVLDHARGIAAGIDHGLVHDALVVERVLDDRARAVRQHVRRDAVAGPDLHQVERRHLLGKLGGLRRRQVCDAAEVERSLRHQVAVDIDGARDAEAHQKAAADVEAAALAVQRAVAHRQPYGVRPRRQGWREAEQGGQAQ
jgi:hypothetical protein